MFNKLRVIILIIAILMIIVGFLFLIGYKGSMTSVIDFNNGTKTITFVGTPHIGRKEYWNKVQNILNKNKVIYEAVRLDMGLDKVMVPYKKLAEYTDTIFQGDVVYYKDDWILSDINMDELLTFYNEKDIDSFDKTIEKIKCLPKFFIKYIFSIVMFVECNFGNDPLVYKRNDKPINTALNCKENVVIFYGEAHRKGMKNILRQKGYRIVSEKKLYPF
jgi:hypothetical protein